MTTEPHSVAFLGPPSSYTHQAALKAFSPDTHTFVPQTTIADIFHAVSSNAATFGVVPFENSTNGSVVFTLDLLCDRNKAHPTVRICAETYLDVHHCLLSASTHEIKDITRLYSHPQAFGQCELWLNSTLKGIERVDVSSTSKAAQLVGSEPGSAAIASSIAAEFHGLKVLARNIEDRGDNTTRFFVLSATEKCPRSVEGADKTLVSFTIDHSLPGALCDSLKVFKDFGLNLTSINSRPSGKRRWNYIFFVEFEGHQDSENVKEAMVELEKFCEEMTVLGSYVDKQKSMSA